MFVDIYCIIVYFKLMVLYQLFSIDKKKAKDSLIISFMYIFNSSDSRYLDNLVKLYQPMTTLFGVFYAHLLLSKGKKLIDF